MDTSADERDYKLLEQDKYTFSVMSRIIRGDLELCLTDHEKLIICFSGQPYPVWIWTPDGAIEEDMERAYQIAKENSFLDGEHHFNIKYELAEYFIKRAAEDGLDLKITTNLFAYDCPDPIAPVSVIDGELHQCTDEDVDVLVEFFDMFHTELNIDQESREQYRLYVEDGIKTGSLYTWKNGDGKIIASSSRTRRPWTRQSKKEFRRKHYAEHLVYEVTKIVQDSGYLPMLYTDADYVASNKCYEKIGYILRGKLCTIG